MCKVVNAPRGSARCGVGGSVETDLPISAEPMASCASCSSTVRSCCEYSGGARTCGGTSDGGHIMIFATAVQHEAATTASLHDLLVDLRPEGRKVVESRNQG